MIDFSEPLFVAGDGLVVLKSDTKDYKALEDLKGDVIGTQFGNSLCPRISENRAFPGVKNLHEWPEAMQAVGDGRLKAAVVWQPDSGLRATSGPFSNLRIDNGIGL